MLRRWYKRLTLYLVRREEKHWRISEEEANKIAAALLYEFGAVKAGEFMDEWRARNT